MRRLMVTALCGLMVLPTLAVADDHGYAPPGNSYRQGGWHDHQDYDNDYRSYSHDDYRPHYYGSPYPYYDGRNHRRDHADDAVWAIGGLVLGAIIGSAVERQSTRAPAAAYAPSRVAKPQKYCDHIVYDSTGNPYVERRCEK